MKFLVENAGNVQSFFPSWKPSPDCSFTEHLSKLDVPNGRDGRPSLLPHGLGETDKEFSERVTKIFFLGTSLVRNDLAYQP